MIITQTVEGRPAVISYMNDQLELVDKREATLIKVMFQDEPKEVIWLVPLHREVAPA